MNDFIEDVLKTILNFADNESISRKDLASILEEELGEKIEEYEISPIVEKAVKLELISQMTNGLLLVTEYGRQTIRNSSTNYYDIWNTDRKPSNDKEKDDYLNPFAVQYFKSLKELIEAYEGYNTNLKIFLKSLLTSMNEYNFESLVIDALVASKEAPYGVVTKKSGDGGIDGFLYQSLLKQGEMPVQVKRYAENNLVQEQEIRDFIGSWGQKHTNGAYFVTTSSYTNKAIKKAEERGIILIDGNLLVELIIEYKVGLEQKEGLEIFFTPNLSLFG